MSKRNDIICDICGCVIDENYDTFFKIVKPSFRFKKIINQFGNSIHEYPKDMCDECFKKFRLFVKNEQLKERKKKNEPPDDV